MRKISILFLSVVLISGCATYKFRHGKEPYHKGYVVLRDDYTILEYTIGKDNTVPPISIAKERFKRRRRIVEHYYKKMGYVENHFKMLFWNPPILALKAAKGLFRMPAVAISDYKYNHNPKYREKVLQREAEEDAREEIRIQKLKDELNVYVQKDLASESGIRVKEVAKEEKITLPQAMPKEEPVIYSKEELIVPKSEEPVIPVEEKPALSVEKKPEIFAEEKKVGVAQAIIIAKPRKGFSPLRVRFYGYRSYSPVGRIVSYSWDFGDTDTSTKINPINTYYSETFTPKYFTVTLTVQDDKGNTSQTTATIEVLNK